MLIKYSLNKLNADIEKAFDKLDKDKSLYSFELVQDLGRIKSSCYYAKLSGENNVYLTPEEIRLVKELIPISGYK